MKKYKFIELTKRFIFYCKISQDFCGLNRQILRHLTRYRKSIVRDITSQKNRIDKLLQSSGFRLSDFIADVFGASGRNIIRHLFTYGSITKEELDKCLRTKTRAKIDQILVVVNGILSKHQQDFLRLMFKHLEQIESHKKVIEASIDNEIATHSEALALLCSIPGIDVTAASSIIAEIGTNMEFFSGTCRQQSLAILHQR